jgi:hypothetical protein
MTLKEILLQELETADDAFVAETIEWVRAAKQRAQESRQENASIPPASGEPILRGSKLEDLIQFAGIWAGDDLEECLETVYATRSQATLNAESDPFH